MGKSLSIYVHIPFCEQKCNYCAFASFCATEGQIDEYISLLCDEIKKRQSNTPVKTIYIGGGTPSILSAEQIEKIVSTIFDNFNIYEDAEFTIEANPNSITEDKLKTWKKLRVNRLSIGVQTLDDKSLRKIGRLHTKKEAIEKVKLARHYFDNVSADLIVGLEGQTGKDLCKYAAQLLDLGVKHISCYLLEIYENTKMFQMIKNGEYRPLDDDATIDGFGKLSNYLLDKGFERYEISNFALPGYESKHNLNYWQRGDYLGFGLGAHSFENGKRYYNLAKFGDYTAGRRELETLSTQEEIEEMIMLGLRCKEGVSLTKLKDLGYDITKNGYFVDYLKQGVLTIEDDICRLNPVFYHISNTIITNLIP